MAETTSKKLVWGNAANKRIHTGVKDVILFNKGTNEDNNTSDYKRGVAWDGITAINLSPSGAETTNLYADNNKYLNLVSAEDFGLTIEAYTYPDEFALCNGEKADALGTGSTGVDLFVAQQARETFGLAFRTEIGDGNNAAESDGAPFELHLIYNITASPSGTDYSTISDSPEAATMSWECTTIPEAITGYNKKTAHLRIRVTPQNVGGTWTIPAKAQALIDALKGKDDSSSSTSDGNYSYLPTPAGVIALLSTP